MVQFLNHPWNTINECAYSSTDATMHSENRERARLAAENVAMCDLTLVAAYSEDEIMAMLNAMAYYIVQIECNITNAGARGWRLVKK